MRPILTALILLLSFGDAHAGEEPASDQGGTSPPPPPGQIESPSSPPPIATVPDPTPAPLPSALLIPSPPRLVRPPEVPFPETAVAAGLEGAVVVEMEVDERGFPRGGVVIREPGGGLGQAVLDALPTAAFDSARNLEGIPVPVRHVFLRLVLDSPAIPDAPPITGTPAAELTSNPELVQFVDAPYPEAALASRLEGSPVLQIDVDARGEVMDVRLDEPAGNGFDEAAVRAAWQFRFKPAQAGDVPVPVTITYAYRFAWQPPPPPLPPPDAPRPEAGISPETAAKRVNPEGPVNLSGVLRERGSRSTLANIEVFIEELEQTSLSDAVGRFSFRGLPEGTWHVLVASPGFEPFRTEEIIRPGEASEVVYYVRPTPSGANRTTVRVREEKKEVQRRTLEISEIEKVPGTFGDPIKAVQNLPGIARSPFDFGLLLVRGSAPEDTGVYVDGIRVPLIYHFGGLRSVLSPVMLDSIDFYPGGYGVTYGRTTGGALDVKSKVQFPKELHGLARIDLIDIEVAVVGPLPRKGDPANPVGGFAVAARRSYLDVVLPAIAPPQLDLSRTSLPRWWDVQGKVQLRPDPRYRFGWFGYASDDAAGLYSEDPITPSDPTSSGEISTRISFTRQMLYLDLKLHPRFTLKGSAAYGFDYNIIDLTQLFRLGASSHSVTTRVDGFWEAFPWLTVHGGADTIVGTYDYEIYFGSADRQSGFTDPNAEKEPLLLEGNNLGMGAGVYLEAIVRPWGERLTLLPGLRFDNYGILDAFSLNTLDPRFSFRVALGRGITTKGSVGIYHQNPQPYEWVEGTGNPDLSAERSPQVTLGGEFQFTDFLSLDIDLFYKSLEDLVVPAFVAENEAGDRLVWENRGQGRIYGGELMLQCKPWHGLQGWIAYTFQRSFRRDNPGDSWYRYDFDQPHILDVVARYQLPGDLAVGARFRLVSGNPYTVSTRLDYDVDSFTYEATSGEYNAERLPTFHQLDIRIDKTFRFRTWKLEAYLEILNVYNRANPEQVTYNFDYSERTYINSLPFLPNLGLRVDF